jgi:uncharacterized protein (TIGR03437 family)
VGGALKGHRKIRMFSRLSCLFLVSALAFSQTTPQIQASGIVNAASYAQPISPGSLVTIFGTNLAVSKMAAESTPLRTELVGTSVLVNGIKAPLMFVSPGQINLQVPSSLPTAYAAYTQATFVVTTTFGSSSAEVPVYSTSPSLFTADGSGCGQAAALNIAADGTVSVNSPSNSAAPGDYIALYGTGAENDYPLADGTYATGPVRLQPSPNIAIDSAVVDYYQYAGLAPFLVGVDQINLQIPQSTREGCAVPISVSEDYLIGPTLSISIHSGRGQCVDPPIQSYGQITVTKTVSTGTGNDGTTETLTATFPSAPGLQGPPQQTILPTGAWMAGDNSSSVSRTCKGNPELSAGAIGVTAVSSGQNIDVQPTPDSQGVVYRQALPNGFIQPGQYSISASGNPVAFEGTFSIDSPIQIQTPLTPGTAISSSQPFVLKWTGGTPGGEVRVSLGGAPRAVYTQYVFGNADVTSGSFTLQPYCYGHSVITGGNGVECSFEIPSTPDVEVIVEVSPAPGNATQITAQGITRTVQVCWVYRYVFGGLTLQ